MNEAGKGDKRRPMSIAQDEWDKRWDAIFSRDIKAEDDAKAEDEAFENIAKQQELNKGK